MWFWRNTSAGHLRPRRRRRSAQPDEAHAHGVNFCVLRRECMRLPGHWWPAWTQQRGSYPLLVVSPVSLCMSERNRVGRAFHAPCTHVPARTWHSLVVARCDPYLRRSASLSRPPTLRVLGCHLADRLGVINPPRTPPRRFPGGDATACGRCFFQPDAGVVFFNPRLTSWSPPHAGYPLMNRGGAHGQYPGRGVLSRTITRCTPPSRPAGVRAWR